jgi:copper chaperone CopZ
MADPQKLEVRVANMDCENEAAAIQRAFRGQPGIVDVETWPKSAKVLLTGTVHDAAHSFGGLAEIVA